MTSTQWVARERAKEGQVAPFVVTAKTQSEGRGRNGRAWESLRGQYSASFVVDRPALPQDAPKLSLVTALALVRVLESWSLGDVSVKWPNDVLIDRKKIAGILLEAENYYVIIGVGVNLSAPVSQAMLDPRALPPVSLSEYKSVGFDAFHQAFSNALFEAISDFSQHGFAPIRQALKGKMLLRETMLFDEGKGAQLIEICDIGEEGELIVEHNGQKKSVYAGDLWFEETR